MSEPDQPTTVEPKWPVWAVSGFLLLVTAVIYGQTLGFDFTHYDDNLFVFDCPPVRSGLTLDSVRWAFTSGPFGEWYPLSMLSHMLDCQLFGLDGRWHHLTNVLLHAATSVGLLLVLWRLTGELWPSGLAATLFAIHPQHVESVAWISERRDVLSGLLFVLTLGAYAAYVRRGRTLGRYLIVMLMLALGLMAKSMLVTVPPLLLVLDFWPLGRFGRVADLPEINAGLARQGFWRLALEKTGLAALSLVDCVMTLTSHYEAPGGEYLSWPDRISNAVISLVWYLAQFFYPANLAAFYPFPVGGYSAWQEAGAAALLCLLTLGAVWARRRCPYLLVGWLWFLGMMAPVSGLIHISDHVRADRYMYLPGIGLGIAVSWGAVRLAAAARAWCYLVTGCAAVAIAVLTTLASRQVAYWHDGLALWQHASALTEENPFTEANLAFELSNSNPPRLDEAIEHFHRSLQRRATSPAYNNLGIALGRQGKLDQAELQFRRALEIDPNFADAHANLGTVWVLKGHYREAMGELFRAIELNPSIYMAQVKVAALLIEAGRLDEAVDHFQRAIELQPEQAAAWAGLAEALAKRGQIEPAILHYRQAARLAPDDANIRRALDDLMAQRGSSR